MLGARRDHLGDGVHHPGAVVRTRHVDDGIDRGRELRPDRLDRQPDPGEQDERLESVERLEHTVRVHRGERSVVTGVQRLQHVERLAASDLSDDDAVGAHPQRGTHEIAHGHGARAFGVRWSGLEPHDVLACELELRGLLDGDDPLVGRDRPSRAR